MTSHPETPTSALPRPVSEFLVAWAMALHRYAIYPPGHPSLLPVAERMLVHLAPALGASPSLVVGVMPHQVVVEGVPSAESHAVLRDLAERLHAQRLGAVVFRRGVELATITGVLELLSKAPVRGERPLGALPARDRPSWARMSLLPLDYDGLELAMAEEGAPGGQTLDRLWVALFRASLEALPSEGMGGDSRTPEGASSLSVPEVEEESDAAPGPHPSEGPLPSAARMAESLRRWVGDLPPSPDPAEPEGLSTRTRTVVEGLQALLDRLRWQGEVRGADLRSRFSDLVVALGTDVLERLLVEGSDRAQRVRLLRDAARAGLAGEALVLLVEATARVDGTHLSPAMEALLRKLSRRADSAERSPTRSEARAALRDQLRELSGEGVDDLLLGEGAGEEASLTAPTPMRVVELALQIDEPGPALEAALADCLRHGDVSAILDLAEAAPASSRTALRVERYLFSPERLRDLLSGADVEERSLRRVVDALGDEAIAPLFEKLADSESRAVRRKAFDRLVALGPRITEHALGYLASEAWYVRRNMLALLQRLPVLPQGFSPIQHLLSEDLRIRREALPLAFRDPGTRERALEIALADEDERVLRGALLELRAGVPEAALALVIERILEGDAHPHLRPLAAQALAGSDRPEARDALLALCTEERGLLGRRRCLAPSTPSVVAAVHALGQGWRGDPAVGWVLEAARAADDPRLRAAAGTPDPTPAPRES